MDVQKLNEEIKQVLKRYNAIISAVPFIDPQTGAIHAKPVYLSTDKKDKKPNKNAIES